MKENTIYLTEPEHYLYKEWIASSSSNMAFVDREISLAGLSNINLGQALNYVRNKIWKNINSHIVLSSKNYDLIHSNGSVILNAQKPWVVDFEDGTAFTFLHTPSKSEKQLVLDSLSSSNCKKLMPHCEAAKKSFFNLYNPSEEIRNKTEVVLPAFPAPKDYDKKTDKFSLLFVARDFERKGGYEAYNAFKNLREELDNIEFICVSDTPIEVKNEDIDGARFYEDVEREKLYHLYREADLFVYPTFHDTFGLVMIEAMAYGNPVITLDEFAANEIVEDSKDGFIIEGYEQKWFEKDTKIRKDEYYNWENLREQHTEEEKARIIKDISDKCYDIISNNKRETMSKNAREKIKEGKFSIERRNKKLNRIYKEVSQSN